MAMGDIKHFRKLGILFLWWFALEKSIFGKQQKHIPAYSDGHMLKEDTGGMEVAKEIHTRFHVPVIYLMPAHIKTHNDRTITDNSNCFEKES